MPNTLMTRAFHQIYTHLISQAKKSIESAIIAAGLHTDQSCAVAVIAVVGHPLSCAAPKKPDVLFSGVSAVYTSDRMFYRNFQSDTDVACPGLILSAAD